MDGRRAEGGRSLEIGGTFMRQLTPAGRMKSAGKQLARGVRNEAQRVGSAVPLQRLPKDFRVASATRNGRTVGVT